MVSNSTLLSRFLTRWRLTKVRYQIVINREHLGPGSVSSSLSYRIQIMWFACIQRGEFGILVKFLRYRRSKPDRVPIIKPALREARLDSAAGCQNHEENYPVSSKAFEAWSRLVRKRINTT